ncbi:MAG: PilZ domain-containing protein [Acidobacteriota bacterium]
MRHPTQKSDRRRFPRHELNNVIWVELRVAMSGAAPAMLLTRGQIDDISFGGLRCDIDLEVPVGTHVDVCFAEGPKGAVVPPSIDGRVVRTVSVGGVPDQVCIAFAQPLEKLETGLLDPWNPAPSLRGRTAAARRASWADEPQSFPTFATGSLI